MTAQSGTGPRTGPTTGHNSTGTRSAGTGPVLARALQILGAFSADRPTMTLSELARQTGLPVSTVHRLLGGLVQWGALERGEDGCYRIGLRLWEVGALAPRGQGLRERALPFLEDLSQITRENVQLAVREGTELVFVERIAGTGAVPVLTRPPRWRSSATFADAAVSNGELASSLTCVGGRFALTATGVGLVLLAHAPVEVQEEVLAGPISRYTPMTLTDPGRLRRMLADVRTSGFAVSDRQVTMDALSVAAPVHDARGAVVAAVSLVVRHGSASPHALAPLLRTSARAISRAVSQPT